MIDYPPTKYADEPAVADPVPQPPARRVSLTPASDITVRPVRWLWSR